MTGVLTVWRYVRRALLLSCLLLIVLAVIGVALKPGQQHPTQTTLSSPGVLTPSPSAPILHPQGRYDATLSEYTRLADKQYRPIKQMLASLEAALPRVANMGRNPAFYNRVTPDPRLPSPEETSSRRACGDPASTLDLFDRTSRRDRNINACAIFLALNPTDETAVERNVAIMIAQRIAFPDEARDTAPFQTIVAYIWLSQLGRRISHLDNLPPIPELTTGDEINPQLIDAVAVGFAKRLIETATVEEKLALRSNVYPDLRRMADLGRVLIEECRAQQRTPCLPERYAGSM